MLRAFRTGSRSLRGVTRISNSVFRNELFFVPKA
jgi:hypothetical protein